MKDEDLEKMSLKMAMVFKAFSDENRIQILEMLKYGEKSAATLLKKLVITQPTLSHHMKILVKAGLVLGRREGRWTHYSIVTEGLNVAMEYVQGLKNILEAAN